MEEQWYGASQHQQQQAQAQQEPQPLQQQGGGGTEQVPWIENSANWYPHEDGAGGAIANPNGSAARARGPGGMGMAAGAGGGAGGMANPAAMDPVQRAALAQQRGAQYRRQEPEPLALPNSGGPGLAQLQQQAAAAPAVAQQHAQAGHDPTPPRQAQQGGHAHIPGQTQQQFSSSPRLLPGGLQHGAVGKPRMGPMDIGGNDARHEPNRWASHTQASMEGVLSCEQAYELLVEDSFQPGHRNPIIRRNQQDLRQPLFKECPKRRLKGEPGADRWRNSGGEKGSSFLRDKQYAIPCPSASAHQPSSSLPRKLIRLSSRRCVKNSRLNCALQGHPGDSPAVRHRLTERRHKAQVPRV